MTKPLPIHNIKQPRKGQPPALSTLLAKYHADYDSKFLRFGQWFMVNYMPNANDSVLWCLYDKDAALGKIKAYYEQYQWEM